jgi:gamma-glutamylcyclotransferase (GGCT)/AIG2-like uncharacterized protein YtfP
MNKLFVYGTLRSSRINSVIPEVAPYIKKTAKGYVKAKLFDLGEYPGAVNADKADKVYGEVIEINPDKLKFVLDALDEYEEVDKNPLKSLFQRKQTLVSTDEGKRMMAWIYWYNKDVNGLKEIKGGVYRKKKNITAA